jgi:(p)ppGpp synthase/HD superfamily hydrolase
MNIWHQEIFTKAWLFATLNHSGQTYGGHEPDMKIDYINHIGSVVMEIMWVLQNTVGVVFDADLAIQCAILHDIIEDTSVTYDEVKTKFGEAVANGVLALTKNDLLENKADKMSDSLKRIKMQPKEVWMVKMADRISNLYHPPYYWNNDKIIGYANEGRIILDELGEANELLKMRLQAKIDNYSSFLR